MAIPLSLSEVPAATPYVQYVATSGQTVFPYPFPITQDSDLIVVDNGVTLATDAGYTLSGQGNDTGGNVTFTAGATVGDIVTLYRDIAIERLTQIGQNSGFSSSAFNAEFNNIYLILQQLEASVSQCLQIPNTNNPAPVTGLTPGSYANKYLAFDGNGNPEPAALTSSGSITGSILSAILSVFTTAAITPDRVRIPAEIAAGVTPVNFAYAPLNLKRYGAKGDGTTDDRAAFIAAWAVAVQMGGGRIVLPDGATYLISSLYGNVDIPAQQSDGSIVNQSTQVALYLTGGNGIDIDFAGSTVKTTITEGGILFLFDGCSHIRLIAPRFSGSQVMSTGVVSLAIATAGSGLTNGTYSNVPLTGGSGGGAVANITVAGAVVSVVPTLVYVGGNYALNDTLSCALGNIGGTGVAPTFTVTSITGAGPVVATAAPAAVAFAALTGNCFDIIVEDFESDSMYTGIWCVANPGATFGVVEQVSLKGNTRITNGYYGLALHNAGDDTVVNNLYAYRLNRPFFIYGAQNFKVNAVGDQVNHGFQPIIKAYSRITRSGSVRYININGPGQSSVVGRLSLQVQCDPAVISPPPYLFDIDISYEETNVFADGSNGIEFDYFSGTGGTTQESSTTNYLFDNITVRGSSGNCLFTTVALTNSANFCHINYDLWRAPWPAAADDPRQNGFVATARLTYTPTIEFGGGAATGWNYSANSADYYIVDGMVHVFGRFTVNTKGSKTGALTFSLPLPPRSDLAVSPLMHGMGLSNLTSLSGPITGFVTTGGGAIANPYIQGATGAAALTDANLNALSDIIWECRYPL